MKKTDLAKTLEEAEKELAVMEGVVSRLRVAVQDRLAHIVRSQKGPKDVALP